MIGTVSGVSGTLTSHPGLPSGARSQQIDTLSHSVAAPSDGWQCSANDALSADEQSTNGGKSSSSWATHTIHDRGVELSSDSEQPINAQSDQTHGIRNERKLLTELLHAEGYVDDL